MYVCYEEIFQSSSITMEISLISTEPGKEQLKIS